MSHAVKLFVLLNLQWVFLCPGFTQTCNITNYSFKAGEEITYIISYNWFIIWTEVGEVSLTIKNDSFKGIPTYRVAGEGYTYPGWDWFFKVRDIYISQIDQSTMKPLYFNREIHEGTYSQIEFFEYNHELGKAFVSHKTKEYPWKYDTIPISSCVFDVITAFIYARNLDYSNIKKDQLFPLTILLDQELYRISFKYIGIENVIIKDMGTYECLKFSLQLIKGVVFEEGSTMFLWVTNDNNHLPVYIESPIVVGAVKARISNIKNNRYPFTSVINKGQ